MTPPNILVVDDHLLNLKLITLILESEGHRVTQAHDAEEALRKLSESVPDLILMDVQLPGMSGLELTKQLRTTATFQRVPIVAVTAYAMPQDQQEALDAGCNAWLTKPIDVEELPGLVKKLLGV